MIPLQLLITMVKDARGGNRMEGDGAGSVRPINHHELTIVKSAQGESFRFLHGIPFIRL